MFNVEPCSAGHIMIFHLLKGCKYYLSQIHVLLSYHGCYYPGQEVSVDGDGLRSTKCLEENDQEAVDQRTQSMASPDAAKSKNLLCSGSHAFTCLWRWERYNWELSQYNQSGSRKGDCYVLQPSPACRIAPRWIFSPVLRSYPS
jgi:hypothetical protein